MPCRVEEDWEAADRLAQSAKKLRASLAQREEWLCEFISHFINNGWGESDINVILDEIDPEFLDWWEEHQKADEERLRKEALEKLTLRERKALGLEA